MASIGFALEHIARGALRGITFGAGDEILAVFPNGRPFGENARYHRSTIGETQGEAFYDWASFYQGIGAGSAVAVGIATRGGLLLGSSILGMLKSGYNMVELSGESQGSAGYGSSYTTYANLGELPALASSLPGALGNKPKTQVL